MSPETREKVLTAAEELGYRANAIARSLATQRTNIIAFVMADLANAFYARALELFANRLQERGYWVLVFKAHEHEADDALLTALQYNVDGIVVTSATLSSNIADECAGRGTPVVLFNRYELNTQASAVCCDNLHAGRMVAGHLVAAGYRRLAYIAGQEGSSTNRDRETGFAVRLQRLGQASWLREPGDYSYESGYAATGRLLSRPDRPDALFCACDMMAFGAIDRALEMGLRVPQDLAVVGFDDIPPAAWPGYSLTTVRQPIERMVDATIELLLAATAVPGAERLLRLVKGSLIVRNSAPLGRAGAAGEPAGA